MKYFFMLFTIILFSACQSSNATETATTKAPSVAKAAFKTTGSVERLSETINDLIPKDAKIEVLADGFTWTEGPLWVESGQYLLFSDIPPNRIMKTRF